MKKLIILLIVLLFVPVAWAQTWHPTNQITMAWDAATNATKYKVYTKAPDGTNIVLKAEVTETTYTYTFTEEGRYFLGVQSIREVDTEVLESTISWSDNIEVCQDAVNFGAVYYVPPDAPIGLRGE